MKIKTDKADYRPGESVEITASGIDEGGLLEFQVLNYGEDRVKGTSDDFYSKTWTVRDGSKQDADAAAGVVMTEWTVPGTAIDSQLEVTARQAGSDGLFGTADDTTATVQFTDAKPGGSTSGTVSVRLDQWADGPVSQGDFDGSGQTQETFVNGNLNAQKAHYNEGDAVPYRAILDDLKTGVVYSLTIQWDTVDSGAYAIDYLTGYNYSFENGRHVNEPDVTPKAGVADLSNTTKEVKALIPSDPTLLTGFGSQFGTVGPNGLGSGRPSGEQFISIFGSVADGTAGSIAPVVSGVTYNSPDLTKASVTITFTYTGSTADNADAVVVAWGGHIASSAEWGGTVETASDISGSPYHMRVLSLGEDGVLRSIGNQDRSLSADAVLAPPPIAGDLIEVQDEDDTSDGIGDTTSPGDDLAFVQSPTLPTENATSVNFASLHSQPVVDSTNVVVKSDGLPLTYFWDGAGLKLYASTNASSLSQAQSTAVFMVEVQQTSPGVFDHLFTLLKQVDHPAATGTAQDNTENDIIVTLTYTAVGEGGSDNGTLQVKLDDDIPTIDGPAVTGRVDEDALTGGIAGGPGDMSGGVSVSASLAGIAQSGADEPAVFSLSADTSSLSQSLTSKGEAVVYDVNAAGTVLTAYVNGTQNGYSEADDREVFTLTLSGDNNATYTFELLDQLDHPLVNDPATAAAETAFEDDLALELGTVLQVTDKDDDTVRAAADRLVVTVNDDSPEADGAAVTGRVDEDALTDGIAGGPGDMSGGVSVSASLAGIAQSGADEPAVFSLSADTSNLPTLTSKGESVEYHVNAAGTVLTAYVDDGADGYSDTDDREVFTLTLSGDNNATYTFELLDQLDHPLVNDPATAAAETAFEDDLALELGTVLQVTDKDDDTVRAAADRLVVTVNDDSPDVLTPSGMTVGNQANATASAALGYFGNVGADESGLVKFVGTEGSLLQGTFQDSTPVLENLTSGGSNIYLFGFGTSTLTATTSQTAGGITGANTVFLMTLNPNGSVEASDLYNITMLKPVDNLQDVNFGSFTAAPSSGNPLTLVVNNIGGSTVDALFQGYQDRSDGTITQTTVNVSTAGVGVGTGQDFDFDPQTSSSTDDLSDRMRISLLNDDGDGVLESGEAATADRFTFLMNQNNPPDDDGDLLVRIYDATGQEIDISGVLINDTLLTFAGVPSNDGGTVTSTDSGLGVVLRGLGGGTAGSSTDNDSVTILGASAYSRIELSALGNDSNKDTFDILLQSLAIPTPFDATFSVQANLMDEDDDQSAAVSLGVTLDADGIFSLSSADAGLLFV